MPPEIKSGGAETSQRARRPGQGDVGGFPGTLQRTMVITPALN